MEVYDICFLSIQVETSLGSQEDLRQVRIELEENFLSSLRRTSSSSSARRGRRRGQTRALSEERYLHEMFSRRTKV